MPCNWADQLSTFCGKLAALPKKELERCGRSTNSGEDQGTLCLHSQTIFAKSQILLCQAGSILEKSYPREYFVKEYEVQVMVTC